ncbi:hypothetical protein H696_03538 [Fonticula alba]|uniref:Metalloenzyme domain-containing protein n=1 Tax=Fonticula alba TaxID=691883 RepID=A0A058Z7J6_FONAL|nr:hypothetical protein H696_03538 [Fonticula alba]KCV70076.1 hypothetical protein H696_03538 [Fonticula alba]|eukprot:XP_009495682.1 hypothetical protein H696_03538 [Fonticula alba]
MSGSTAPTAKVVWVLIDGVGDLPVASLGDRTCLQAADKPNLDCLARHGLNGLIDPVEAGLACGSDTAHLNLLGYNPRVWYRGRGAFESMGAGLDMAPGDIAFKSNFAIRDLSTGIVTSRRADRNFEEAGPILCQALDGVVLPDFPDIRVRVRYATEHRCGVVLSGPGLSDAISGTDPLRDNLPLVKCRPLDGSRSAEYTSKVIAQLSDEFTCILSAHPHNRLRAEQGLPAANCVLLRGCGVRLDLPALGTTFDTPGKPTIAGAPIRGFAIAPTCIIAGIGINVGLDVIPVAGATGDYHSDYSAKCQAVLDNIARPEYSLAFMHVKGIDDSGHDFNVSMRIALLERLDHALGKLIAGLQKLEAERPNEKYFVVVTGDHSTPVMYGDHTAEPVPVAVTPVAGLPASGSSPCPDTLWDGVCRFDEVSAGQGVLGRFPGRELLPFVLALAKHQSGADQLPMQSP